MLHMLGECRCDPHTISSKPDLVKKVGKGAGEMTQWLRALPALPKVRSSIPGNHIMAQNDVK